MDDLIATLIQDFLDEAIPLAERASSCFLSLERAWEAGGADELALRESRSALHTLKGNAAMMGLGGVEAVAHALEDALTLADAPERRSFATADLLLEGGDLLQRLVREARGGPPTDGAAEAFASRVRELAADLPARHEAPKPGIERARGGLAPSGVESVRVQLGHLDRMIDLADEAAILHAELARSAQELYRSCGAIPEVTRLELGAAALHKVQKELQRALLTARLVPLGLLFSRFERYVRDLARERGQPIRLVTAGDEVTVDRAIIDRIAEPLLHLIRNAVAHGIEPAEARAGAAKPERATLTLAARCREGRVEITVADDGRGIDRGAVLARARALGYETRELSPDAELRLVFAPGLSTAASVSTLAGRGVGLDVVAGTVHALGGHIEVRSADGQGAAFTLDLPITLAMIKALLVEVDGETFALPATYIAEAVRVEPGARGELHRRGMLSWRDQILHAVDGGALLETPLRRGEARRYCVVLAVGRRRRGMLVDRLLGYQEILVKSLDPLLGPLHLVSGAALLGDGRVVLVLDLSRIAEAPAAAPDARALRGGAPRRDEVLP